MTELSSRLTSARELLRLWLPCQAGIGLASELDLNALFFQPALGVHRGFGSLAGRRHRLTVAVVPHIAGHEDTVDRGRSGFSIYCHGITTLVQGQLPLEDVGVRMVTDGHKHRVGGVFVDGSGLDVSNLQSGYL